MGFISYFTGSKGASGFGSSSTAEQVADGISLATHTAIVTGATAGIGTETARVLAKQGAQIVLPVRNIKTGEEVRENILKEFPQASIYVLEMDLSSLASVRKFVAEFKALELPLNILINNAGLAYPTFCLSPDGLELDIATNHIGHFLLVELLLDDMIKTASETEIEGRIVNVASEAHIFARGINFDKLNDENSFQWMVAYGRSKLANMLHAKVLAKRLKERNVNVTINSLHPGTINTSLFRGFSKPVLKTLYFICKPFVKNIAQGAATTVYAAVHPSVTGVSGVYFVDCNNATSTTTSYAKDMKLAEELWNFSEKFIQDH